jgi:UDP-N-acetylmuramoyl-tripeptide--D-alanyl-D-alanine ligase
MATAIPENRAPFTVEEIARATGGRIVRGGGPSIGVSTDSRAIAEGAAFVALTGDNFDGHAFLTSVVAQGARTLIVSRDDLGELTSGAEGEHGAPGAQNAKPAIVRVNDTRAALGDLSRAHRKRWGAQSSPRIVAAITGSAGKTTTKAVLARILDAMAPGQVHATAGNLNNDIGVPMTLLGLDAAHHYAVVEMGTNARGEIANLAKIAEPDAGVVTLVAAAHTEGIGTVDDVAVEKGALLAALPPSGLAVANADDARASAQIARSPAKRALTFGFAEKADYRIVRAESRGADGARLCIERRANAVGSGALKSETIEVDSPLLGEAGALAVAASLAVAEWSVGRAAKVEEIAAALSSLAAAADGRLNIVPLSDGTIVIDDSYNANPASMRASLRAARDVAVREKRRLVVVLGEMRELGAMSIAEHEALGKEVAHMDVACVVGVSGEAERVTREALAAGKSATFAKSVEEAASLVASAVRAGDVVLVKGSRGVATEKIVRVLSDARGRAARRGGAS